MRTFVLLTLTVVPGIGVASAQHGTAGFGYYPLGYHGDIFTGQVIAVNDATREITLRYQKKDKTQTFVGTLQAGYKLKRKDGTEGEVKVSEIPIGMRLTVYYMPKSEKVNGKRTTHYEIFRFTTTQPASSP
jgi:hypothetical protein